MKNIWFFCIGAFAIGFAAGIFSGNIIIHKQESDAKIFEVHQGGFTFINPLLECELGGDDIEFRELRSFREDLQELIGSLKGRNWITHSAVYFRDLNNGPWFGISEKEQFTPASLLKVPLMMAYYKEAESNPKILHDRIRFGAHDRSFAQNTKPSRVLVPGETYSVDELIRRAIADSDNDASFLLFGHLDVKKLVTTYTDLGIPLPDNTSRENLMTVKQYATFFRILFNASYLNREMSEKALELLSQTGFRDGILASLPAGVRVAHKFGERGSGTMNEKQMHDCGIVYYPDHPYLVCIMTRGESFDHLDDSIREISGLIFTHVDRQFAKR